MIDSYSFQENKFKNHSISNFQAESFGYDSAFLFTTFDHLINKKTIKWSEISFEYSVVFYWENRFYLKKNIFGNVPLFYFIKDKEIFFSTNIKELSNHYHYKKELNTDFIFCYLQNIQNPNGYSETTIWKNIYSVIPGLLLEINEDGSKNYINVFEFEPKKHTSDNYSEEFKNNFLKSLAQKVDFNKSVCTALSGGLDSSSIACFAQLGSKRKINTIEFRIRNEINAERDYAQSIVDKIKTNHTIIDLNFDNIEPDEYYKIQEKVVKITGQPINPYSVGWKDFKIIEAIKKNNGEYFLTGQGGDDVFINRSSYLNSLFTSKDYIGLGKALTVILKMHLKHDNVKNGLKFISSIILNDIINLFSERNYINIYKYIIKVVKIKYLYQLIFSIYNSILNRILNPELFRNNFRSVIKKNVFVLNELGQLKFIQEKIKNEMDFNYVAESLRPQALKNLEQSYTLGKHFGIRFVNPYIDMKLMEFIVNVPKEYSFYNGFGRGLIRNSGVLSEKVKYRVNKTVFKHYHLDVLNELFNTMQKKFDTNHIIWDFVEKNKFVELSNILINKRKSNSPYNIDDVFGLLRIIYIGIWLDVNFYQ